MIVERCYVYHYNLLFIYLYVTGPFIFQAVEWPHQNYTSGWMIGQARKIDLDIMLSLS